MASEVFCDNQKCLWMLDGKCTNEMIDLTLSSDDLDDVLLCESFNGLMED